MGPKKIWSIFGIQEGVVKKLLLEPCFGLPNQTVEEKHGGYLVEGGDHRKVDSDEGQFKSFTQLNMQCLAARWDVNFNTRLTHLKAPFCSWFPQALVMLMPVDAATVLRVWNRQASLRLGGPTKKLCLMRSKR